MDEQKYNLKESVAELDKLLDLSLEQTDKTACEDLAEKARIIYEQFPESEEIALRYINTLSKLADKQTEFEEVNRTVEKVKIIYEKFRNSEEIASWYAAALSKSADKQTEIGEVNRTVEKVKIIYEKFHNSKRIASWYAWLLQNLVAKQTEIGEVNRTVEKVKIIYEKFRNSEEIASWYAAALSKSADKQTEIGEVNRTVEKVKIIYEKFHNSKRIASWYAWLLQNLVAKQTEIGEVNRTVEKVKIIYEKFRNSEEIASWYAAALSKSADKQTEIGEVNRTVEKVKIIYEKFHNSEEIASWYAGSLSKLADKQTEIGELRHTVKQICDILKSIPSVKSFATLVKILEKNPDTPLDTNNTPSTSLTKILDKLCFYSNDGFDRKLLIRALNLDLVINTKYDILKDWVKHYKDDENKLNQLIDIYSIVQEIKYQLGLKVKYKNLNLKFGHYTKGKTLQDLLNQDTGNTDDTKFSVSGKTRLYNANYMNDPEEGLVIEEMLKPSKDQEITSYFEKRNILEPSPWFLMSFTSQTDDLAMWSQYGDDAQGVCLVLREDDFSRFTSFNDVSWRKEAIPLETVNQIDSTISCLSNDLKTSVDESKKKESTFSANVEEVQPQPEKNKVAKGNIDYLYRIAYVKNTGKNFELEKSELFDDNEIKKLKESINNLKQKLYERVNDNDDFYKEAISSCIEEIRYLFKSVDYKYENELRILRYANLDPSNKEIKIDKSSGIGKLYVERKNSIQIGEVIFGPKFPNPEYVTPLLKLLDKNINYRKSTIKFR